ncbi:MAG: hypothetical protein IPG61_03815 [bacterium]|nr:hypothetical protein [bacterium]
MANPSTNSYKRLVPGFEALTVRTMGKSNRGAAIRILSYVRDASLRRVESTGPRPDRQSCLCCAAILMAGLDGIEKGIDPVALGFAPEAVPVNERKPIDYLPRSLADALDALEHDHEFLLRGGVFDEKLIERWLAIKRDEIADMNRRPHPYEYTMYFDF